MVSLLIEIPSSLEGSLYSTSDSLSPFLSSVLSARWWQHMAKARWHQEPDTGPWVLVRVSMLGRSAVPLLTCQLPWQRGSG